MAQIIDARVKQKTGTAADFAGYTLLEGEIALVRTSASGPVWNFKVGPGNFDSLDWSLQNPGAAQKADTSTVFPSGVPGLYIPTESGTYDGVSVDLSAGYTQLIWDGSALVKAEFPIDLSGYATLNDIDGQIQEGETKAPNGNTIFSQLDPYITLTENIDFELYNGSGAFTVEGNYSTSNNWVSTRILTVDEAGERINISGYQDSVGKQVKFYQTSDTQNQNALNIAIPEGTEWGFDTPSGYSKMIVNVALGTDVGADIPNSPYWNTFVVARGDQEIKTDKIKDRIESEQLLAIESKLDGLEDSGTNFLGAGAPPYMYGIDNATYLDSITGRLYTKTDGLWDNGVTPLSFEIEQTYPVDFTWQPGVIYRQKNGAYCMKGYENITTQVQADIMSLTPSFVDVTNGSNSNPGTFEEPYKSIKTALAAGNRLIVIRGGIYSRVDGIDAYVDPAVSDPLIILPYQNERVSLVSGDPGSDFSWTADENVFRTSRSNTRAIINTDMYDRATGFRNYDRVDDLVTCKATPFSWYTDGTLIYVNNNDLGVPAGNIQVILRVNGFNSFEVSSAQFIYIEGIDTYVQSAAGSLSIKSDAVTQTDANVYVKNVRGYDNREGNIISILGVKEAYLQNAYGWGPLRDAINYHVTFEGFEKMKFLEINGGSLDTGRNTTGEFSSNGSTSHDGITGIRLGGSFDTARGGVVIDVNPGTYTLNYGVQSKNQVLPPPSVAASFQANDNSIVRLFACYAKGDNALTANNDATLYADSETIVDGAINGNVIIE